MPPSGFSQPAINGLLVFVRDSYKHTLDSYRYKDLTEERVLNEAISHLERYVAQSTNSLPVSTEGIKGLQQFVSTNFRDLIHEIHIGKKTEGNAMQAEIDSIGKYLEQFKI